MGERETKKEKRVENYYNIIFFYLMNDKIKQKGALKCGVIENIKGKHFCFLLLP